MALLRGQEDWKKVTWWVTGALAGLAEVERAGALGDVQRKGGLRLRRWIV